MNSRLSKMIYWKKNLSKPSSKICIEDISTKLGLRPYEHNTGKYADVYMGKDVVVKVIPLSLEAWEKHHSLDFDAWRELWCIRLINQILESKKCPHFPLMYSWYLCDKCKFMKKDLQERRCLIIVYEKANTTLKRHLKHNDFTNLNDDKKHQFMMNIIFQTLMGLYCIQKTFNLIHGDLHWNNILLKQDKNMGKIKYIINYFDFFLPSVGYKAWITDFGKSNLKEDFLITKDYTGSSSKTFILLSSDTWEDVAEYKSKRFCYDVKTVTWSSQWIQENNNVLPSKTFTIFDKIHKDCSSIINILLDEFYMYLNPSIGKKGPSTDEKVLSPQPGQIVIYKGKYVLVREVKLFQVTIITDIDKFEMTIVDQGFLKIPKSIPKVKVKETFLI